MCTASVLAAPAAAQQGGEGPEAAVVTPTHAARERAREHFGAAMEHYRAHRYREAIREFRLSIAQLPNADLWFNVARAYERLGESGAAIEHYRLYLRDRIDAPDAAEVEARIAELERTSPAHTSARQRGELAGTLAIDAAEPGALVLLDGERLGFSPIDRMLQVAPGRHRLEASRPGYIPFRAELDVQPGALSAAYIELRPLTRVREASADRVFTWIAAAGSAGALLASGALGLWALDRRDAGQDERARDLAMASDLTLGGGITLAVAAVLLHFVEGEPEDTQKATALRAGAR